MGDLLKEAIADAKAVRETALANAKMALEEAFTPQLKSMLSAKLREDEDEFGDEVPAEEDEFGDEEVPAEVPAEEVPEEGYYEDEVPAEEVPAEDEFGVAEVPAEEGEFGDEEIPAEVPAEEGEFGDEEPEVAEVMQINGHTYRLAEEEDEDGEEVFEGDDEESEDKLDLESVIKELEQEIDDDDEEVSEEIEPDKTEYEEDTSDGYEDNVDGDKDEKQVGGDIGESTIFDIDDEIFEQSDSSDIGNGDNKVDVADSSDEEDPGANEDKPGAGASGNIGEAYKKVSSELKEYKEAVVFLKDKLHEVNILNAKLLFTNKLFKEYVLDNNQKLRVVETFDRAQTVREIKLIFSTLAESFKNSSNVKTKKSITESASKKSGSTKPTRKIISEENEVADRFKKLAGLIN